MKPDEQALVALAAEAKELLRSSLAEHPDEWVRALNGITELADDHPVVVRIARALAARKPQP